MTETAVERKLLGVVEVNSGTLIISDPANCLPHHARDKSGLDYEAVIEADTSVTASYLENGLVLLVSNFGGDRTFPVFGEFEDGELMRVMAEFVGPDEDDEGGESGSAQ